jgi:23S rRNA (pseudouridine1915-N3)-methyltransferase
MRIRLISAGKIKNEQLRALEEGYLGRLRHFAELSIEQVHSKKRARNSSETPCQKGLTTAERQFLGKLDNSYKVVLDAAGQQLTSEAFAAWLGERGVRGTRELAFLVGAPLGFSQAFKAQADFPLALSRMTLTRDWARVLLLEQIYRAFTILRGYPYAK